MDEKMTNKELTCKIFEHDGFVKLTGAEVISLTESSAIVRARIGEEHQNANGCVQGGMLYTVADFAFALLGNYLHPVTVTQSGQISYIRAAYTSVITATAKEIVRAGHNTVSEVIVRDEQDQIVCVCTFNGFVKDVDRKELQKKYE